MTLKSKRSFVFGLLTLAALAGSQLYPSANLLVSRAKAQAARGEAASSPSAPSATAKVRLNPVIEKLAAGKPFIGVSTEDLSFANANELTRAPIDYVYVDMEHTPFSFDNLYHFTLGTIDKAATAKRGNPQADLAVFARFPPYGREQVQWVSKQALDIGLMGIIFNSIDNAEQAAQAVQSMRYPQLKGAKIPDPNGKRGWSPALATWLWGVSQNEYREAADLWPLNPDGNLLAIMMIETADGLKNADAIAAVPGVGAIFIGPADLANSMGVTGNAPEVEQALQTILIACKAHNVACGKTMSAAEMPRRLQEGWKMINLGSSSGGLTAGPDAVLKSIPENIR